MLSPPLQSKPSLSRLTSLKATLSRSVRSLAQLRPTGPRSKAGGARRPHGPPDSETSTLAQSTLEDMGDDCSVWRDDVLSALGDVLGRCTEPGVFVDTTETCT